MDVGLVCDACSTFNPMDAQVCSRCDAPLSLEAHGANGTDARAAAATAAAQPAVAAKPAQPAAAEQANAADVTCPSCGAHVGAENHFCGACGARLGGGAPLTQPAAPAKTGKSAKKTLFFGVMQATRAKLVLIKGDGLDGVSFTLAGDEHLAGRRDVPLLFEEDPFLSPVHANFFYRSGQLVVRDEQSVNGVFIRIRGSHAVEFGDRFLVGEQVLEVQESLTEESLAPHEDGTYFYASPTESSRFRLVQILRGGDTGLAYRPESDVVALGREGNDIDFPDDPFISGHHAQVSFVDGALSLTDLGSKNGTFLRVNEEARLQHGDYVFMGQQLLRVEIV